jgi:uncharacterized circularly permuted ATP-grasp superfamily protein/transglutaminase-like putative cysteine protease/uncharacterized alpha-E superfamily protein
MPLHVALTHSTTYRYDRPVTLGPQTIRLRPAPQARTPILSYSLTVAPQPHSINWMQDPQGNHLARVLFPERVTHFDVTVDLVADMVPINPFDFFLEPEAEAWPFAYDPILEQGLAPYHRRASPGPLLAELVAGLPRARTGTVDKLIQLNRRVQERVAYIARLDPGVLTPEETLASGEGSCRDSAWLLVQVLRSLGFAARFVSGYLIQLIADVMPLDGPARPKEDGADLHAWAEVYLPGAGWIGLDATSGLMTGEGHIPLAASPDPISAAPITGSVEKSEATFDFRIAIRRVMETPRVSPPYAEQQRRGVVSAGEPSSHPRPAPGARPRGALGGPLDEMVDGLGGLRPHWRGLLGALTGLGREGLAERAVRLDRAFEEEGVTSLLPGATADPRQCDPVPLLMSETEFAAIAGGLAQRARLFEAVLADIYGPQRLLAEGALPPSLVFENRSFLRPRRATNQVADRRMLGFYAADLARGPDGAWRVIADHTDWAEGVAEAVENRRMLSRVVPEIFQPQAIRSLRPFVEAWQGSLQSLLPPAENTGVALLTPGYGDPAWYDHVLLARALSCALVEGGDLTVRGNGVFLKTLRGLQPIPVLLRAMDGCLIDPLELAPDGIGTPGLLEAARGGALRIVNDPGTGLVEAPGLSVFMPDLARRLLGETLELPCLETRWLGTPRVAQGVEAEPDRWAIRSATDRGVPPECLDRLSPREREQRLARIAEAPWNFIACVPVRPSVAPCAAPTAPGSDGFVPRPVVIRLFLIHDGEAWRAMQGGLVRVLADDGAPAWCLPPCGLAKDLWVLAETPGAIVGPPSTPTPTLPIRRMSGDLPSRVADNFFWLGRYLERLEGSARLQRAGIGRIVRPAPTPRQMAELRLLTRCFARAGLEDRDIDWSLGTGALAATLLRAAQDRGPTGRLLALVSRATGLLRDRLTGEMYATMSRGLRELSDALRRVGTATGGEELEELSHTLAAVLHFAATVAGLAAENMVRSGGRLFLDLGRRVERAQTIADEVACVLEPPGAVVQPGHVDLALRLTLELRDSVITYQSRYLGVLQPAPALDLVLGDESNPRGLAFQLAAARDLLGEIAGSADTSLAATAAALLDDARDMVRGVAEATEQAEAAARLPPRLLALKRAIAELSDLVVRRYFSLLPASRGVGLEVPPTLRGAA